MSMSRVSAAEERKRRSGTDMCEGKRNWKANTHGRQKDSEEGGCTGTGVETRRETEEDIT